MAYHRALPTSINIASGVSLSSAIDLGLACDKVLLGIPVIASGTNVNVFICESLSGTYRSLYHEPVAATPTPVQVSISSAVTNCFVPLSILNAQYLKIQVPSITATSPTFTVLGISL